MLLERFDCLELANRNNGSLEETDRWNLQEGIFAKAVPSTGKIILFLEVLDISETMLLDLWTSVTSLSYEIYQLTLGRSSKWRGVE